MRLANLEIHVLYSALLDARFAVRKAQEAFTAALLAACPYKAGQVIQSTQGYFAKITAVRFVEKDVEISAVIRKKDGTWGTVYAPTWLSEWENPVIVVNPDGSSQL